MLIEIELVGKASRWSYEQPHIRIGRDPSCDLSLPEYSMVSREHLALEVSGASLSLTDTRSANGTYLNGARVTAAAIISGDRLRLGAEGPELRIYFKEAPGNVVNLCTPSPDIFSEFGSDYRGLIGRTLKVAGDIDGLCIPHGGIRVVQSKQAYVYGTEPAVP